MTTTEVPGPKLRVTAVTIGSSQPRLLAAFYARLLGWPVTTSDPAPPGEGDNGGWAQIQPPEGSGEPTISFEYEAQFDRPVWPAQPGRPVATQHLDIWVEDLEASVAWAQERGARVAEFQPQADVRVMLDPDGHPFCLYL